MHRLIYQDMSENNKEIIERYLKRLKTVKNKAYDEMVTTQCVYQRIRKGIYNAVSIDGVIFVLEAENKE